jgi:hypothetical protein
MSRKNKKLNNSNILPNNDNIDDLTDKKLNIKYDLEKSHNIIINKNDLNLEIIQNLYNELNNYIYSLSLPIGENLSYSKIIDLYDNLNSNY